MQEIMTMKRLSKVLAAAGIASRRQAERIIFNGRVKINGEVVIKPQTMIDAKVDKILVDGVELEKPENKLYFVLNKPVGYICSNERPKDKKIVLDYLEEICGIGF